MELWHDLLILHEALWAVMKQVQNMVFVGVRSVAGVDDGVKQEWTLLDPLSSLIQIPLLLIALVKRVVCRDIICIFGQGYSARLLSTQVKIEDTIRSHHGSSRYESGTAMHRNA
jgi:hypothetical protein